MCIWFYIRWLFKRAVRAKKNILGFLEKMPPTLVLLDEWPNTRACPVSHDALGAHDVLKDVLLSDTDRLRSLRDMISDGALFAELRRAGVAIEPSP